MNPQRKTVRRVRHRAARRGAMVVLIAVMLAAFLIVAGMAMNVAYMQLTRTQLRTATDAAAKAAVEALQRTQSVASARTAARDVAALNAVAGVGLTLTDSQIVFGGTVQQSDGSWAFTPGATPSNAARVTGSRTGSSANGGITMFFGSMLGRTYFEPQMTAVASQVDRDICLVLDRSGSMAFDLSGVDWQYPSPYTYPSAYCMAPHPTLSRWAFADAATRVFLAECEATTQTEQIALVSYASGGNWCSQRYSASTINSELTTNYTTLTTALSAITNNAIPGGTSISSGIDTGVTVLTRAGFARSFALKTMVVMTDGIHNSGRPPLNAARDAAAQNITIHTVTYSTDADQTAMKAVAAAAGGQHFHAPDGTQLREIFREIAATLPVVLTE